MTENALLIVDGDARFADELRRALAPQGYRTLVAASCAAAGRLAAEGSPRVALVAMRLPDGRAADVLAALAEAAPGCVPIVVVRPIEVDAAQAALAQGAHACLRRPLRAVELRRAVADAFELVELRQQQEAADHGVHARLEGLADVAHTLGACSGTDELGQSLLEQFARELAAGGGSLFLRHNGKLALAHSLDPGHAPPDIPLPLREGSVFERVARTRRAVLVRDIGQEGAAARSGWAGYRDGSLLAFPFLDGRSRLVGVLSLHNKARPPFTRSDLEVGRVLAVFGAEALRAVRAVERLRATQDQSRRLIDLSPEPIAIVQDGALKLISASFTEVFGYAETDLADGLACRDLLPDEPQDAAPHFCEGYPPRQGDPPSCRLDLLSKGGMRVPCEVRAAPIGFDGRPARFLILRNLTQTTWAQQALERERDLVAAILDTVGALIVILDTEGRIVHFNRACEQTTGYRFGEVLGNTLWDVFVVPEELDEVRAIFQGLKAGHFPNQHESHWLTKDGGRRFISWANTCMLDGQGRIEYIIGTGIDTTAGREAQAMLSDREAQLAQFQKMEAIGRLAGGVAHDFNNLLTAVICCSELLAESLPDDDAEAREYLDEILKSGERGTSLVRQLMAFSRSQVLEPTVLDLNAVVLDIEQMLRHLIGEDVQLVTLLAPELPSVTADQNQIEMVLMNLGVNARDAMPTGGKLTLATRLVDLTSGEAPPRPGVGPGRYVELSVADTRVGMTADVRQHAIDPFLTTKGQGQGTGLGLSTVYGIVTQSGGHITCDSAPGQGATFHILLPAGPRAARLTARRPVAAEALRGTETVLVVEDEAPVLRLAVAILENQGYNVLGAASPGDALLLCQQHHGPIHLLLTDVVMPLMSGFELADRLAEVRPDTSVLFMSAHAAAALRRYANGGRPPTVLQKPFGRELLIRKVRETLDTPRHERAR